MATLKSKNEPTTLAWQQRYLPIPIAFYAHCMATIWQHHFGAGFQTNPTFFFSLQIYIGQPKVTFHFLLAHRLHSQMLAIDIIQLFHVTM